mgnify:CR=1 FL=1
MGLGAKINVLMIRPAMQSCLQLFTRLLNSIFGALDLARSGLVIVAEFADSGIYGSFHVDIGNVLSASGRARFLYPNAVLATD